METLEREKASKAMLESQNKAQVEFNCELQDEVAQLRAQLSMAQTSGERQAGKLVDSEGSEERAGSCLGSCSLQSEGGRSHPAETTQHHSGESQQLSRLSHSPFTFD